MCARDHSHRLAHARARHGAFRVPLACAQEDIWVRWQRQLALHTEGPRPCCRKELGCAARELLTLSELTRCKGLRGAVSERRVCRRGAGCAVRQLLRVGSSRGVCEGMRRGREVTRCGAVSVLDGCRDDAVGGEGAKEEGGWSTAE